MKNLAAKCQVKISVFYYHTEGMNEFIPFLNA